jgi:dihydrolipoamide dehydrogenase
MSTNDFDVDVVVIGAGSAGLVARRAALAEGATVLMCDPGPYGTTCARVGCMPSKLLIAPAEVARAARGAGRFGIDTGPVSVDARRVFARVRAERDRFAGFVVSDVEALPDGALLRERVRFTGPETLVSTSGKRIRARATVIATGSTIMVPGIFFNGLKSTLLTSDTVFELQTIPRRLAVIGGGIVGLELGQALAQLGAETTLFDSRTSLGPTTDPVVSAEIVALMGHDMSLRLGGAVVAAEEVDGEARLTWRNADGRDETLVFDAVLVAVGRAPNVRDIGLETTGATLDARGMPRFDTHSLHIDGTPLFIAGDANAYRPLLHEATDEGRIAGRNAADYARYGADGVHRYERRAALAVAFSHPQIAMAGMSFAEAERRGAAIGAVSFRNQGRARVQGENAGIMRLYAEPGSGRMLGAEMVCPAAEHLAHLIAWVIQARLGVLEVLEMPFYHPVVEEGLRTGLRELAEACGLGKAPPLRCLDCGPGH